MYQAEHLDLITQVSDNFTSPLTRLSGLLETVGQQADQLDPIYIRTVVQDRQLRQLNRRLARAQSHQIGAAMGGGSMSSRFPGGGRQHTLADVTNTLSNTVSDLGDAVGGDGSSTSAAQTTMMMGMMSMMDNMRDTMADATKATAGMADSADQAENVISQLTPKQMGDILGMPVGTMAMGHQIDPTAMMSGESPFVAPMDHLEDAISPEAITEALDMRQLTASMSPSAIQQFGLMDSDDILGDLAQLNPNELTKLFGTENLEGVFNSLGDSVDGTTLQFEQLKESFFDIRIGMTQFYDFLAAAVPLMFVFIGSLPAIIGAFGGLTAAALGAAGALAGIAGLGILGAAQSQAGGDIPGMEDFMDLADGLGEDFFDSFRPLLNRFEGTINDAIDAIPQFFDELARVSTVLVALENDFRDFGRFISSFTTGTIGELLTFADVARPIFSDIAEGMSNLDMTRGFASALGDVLPHIQNLTVIILGALPALQSFSQGMLDVFTSIVNAYNAILPFLSTAASFFGMFGDGNRILGRFVAGIFVLMSATFLATKVAAIFRASLFQLASSMLGSSMSAKGLAATLRGPYTLSTKVATAATMGFYGAVTLAKKAVLGLLAMTGVGLVIAGIGKGVAALADQFGILNTEINNTRDSLEEFARQRDHMSGGSSFVGDLDGNVYVDVTNNRDVTFNGAADDGIAEYESFIDSDPNTF